MNFAGTLRDRDGDRQWFGAVSIEDSDELAIGCTATPVGQAGLAGLKSIAPANTNDCLS